MIRNKLYPIIATVILTFLGWVYYIYTDRNALKVDIQEKNVHIEQAKQTIEAITAEREIENTNRKELINRLEVEKNESERLKTCIADKSCVATVRVRVKADCPGLPAQNNSDRASSGSAVLTADAERAYFNLRAGIVELEGKYKFCQQTLQAWAQ